MWRYLTLSAYSVQELLSVFFCIPPLTWDLTFNLTTDLLLCHHPSFAELRDPGPEKVSGLRKAIHPGEAKSRRRAGPGSCTVPSLLAKGLCASLCFMLFSRCGWPLVQRWWSWPEGDLSGSAGRQILPSTDLSDRPTLTQRTKQWVSSNRLVLGDRKGWVGLRGRAYAVSPWTSLRFKFTVGKTHRLFPWS